MSKSISISNRKIGARYPALIIAELSENHLQNYKIAVKSIKAIKNSGADAVKLQTFSPDTMTIDSANNYFKIKQGTLWDGQTLYQLYKKAYMPWPWQSKLKNIAEDMGLIFFSSPFDRSAVDFLEKLNVPAYKIASYEITDIPLIEYVASKNKPVIISTGVASYSDIKEALTACKRAGNNKIILLKCTSMYPAALNTVNLKMIPEIAKNFKCITGISDHTLGISIPVAAVALGARVIEKHFILDKKLKSHDSAFSLDQLEFKELVKSVRDVEAALGKVSYGLSDKIKRNRQLCRSLFIVEDIKKGEFLTNKNIRSIRPGYGLPPKYLKDIIGKKAKKNSRKGTPLSWSLIE